MSGEVVQFGKCVLYKHAREHEFGPVAGMLKPDTAARVCNSSPGRVGTGRLLAGQPSQSGALRGQRVIFSQI